MDGYAGVLNDSDIDVTGEVFSELMDEDGFTRAHITGEKLRQFLMIRSKSLAKASISLYRSFSSLFSIVLKSMGSLITVK